ncbi:hypothetical protein AVEN_234043-1 [Araneus ventricosus]|uniref:DUF4203 domain-containing protein n=1 Tax=Araneus ventricosus TaxID=182803 RepID=A0A4Y2FKM8_ARAVE|nr:hypothetical protein AVEN_234043-1 [Araneus ventricosus]
MGAVVVLTGLCCFHGSWGGCLTGAVSVLTGAVVALTLAVAVSLTGSVAVLTGGCGYLTGTPVNIVHTKNSSSTSAQNSKSDGGRKDRDQQRGIDSDFAIM